MSNQPTSDPDFPTECREAFVNLCLTRNQIDPDQPTQRLHNQAKRLRLMGQIDQVLDAYLDWQEVEPFEAQMVAGSAASTDVAVVELPVDGDWRNW
jgi:hypothetical protein